MDYGGSRKDAGEAVGQSGDGGVDGIIKEDKLDLDAIYLQAKRWDNTVGRPIVQALAGSLEGDRARKRCVDYNISVLARGIWTMLPGSKRKSF
jgi:restriction system protein